MQQYYHYLSATGKLHYNMTNDYMFRMVLQRDNNTLKNLICSVLGLSHESVVSVTIENTVEPGQAMNDKEHQLDILVLMNDNTFINLEMQVENYNNWPMRSLCYLCRRFDTASRGADYNTVKPVYHVGFLDFTLFEDHPEFVAKYKLRNDKDRHVYTDNFNLFVISLNQTELATQEDKAYGIDKWAKLFKAKTWEEIKMITKDNPSMNSTAESIFMSDADFLIREQCRRREDAIAHEKYQKELIETLTKEKETIAKEKEIIAKENETIAKEKESIAEKYDTLTSEYEHLKKLLADNGIDPGK